MLTGDEFIAPAGRKRGHSVKELVRIDGEDCGRRCGGMFLFLINDGVHTRTENENEDTYLNAPKLHCSYVRVVTVDHLWWENIS